MTVTVTAKSRTITNGTANDGSVVEAEMVELYNNDATLATAINSTNTTVTTNNTTFLNTVPPGYKFGCKPAWASNTTITLTAGTYADATATTTNVITVANTITLDISTSGALGLDTGGVAANTWYYVWLFQGASGVTAAFSLSSTSPTAPAGYTTLKRLLPFAIRTDASSHIANFVVGPSWPNQPLILYQSYILSDGGGSGAFTQAVYGGTSTTNSNLDCSALIPPISKMGYFKASVATANGVATVATFGYSGNDSQQIMAQNSASVNDFPFYMQTNSSQVIYYRISSPGTRVSAWVQGFVVTEVA